MSTAPTPRLDAIGVALSLACLAHCVLLPVVAVGAAAGAGAWAAGRGGHAVLALALVPVALGAALRGWRRHRRAPVAAALVAGLALAVAAVGGDVLGASETAERLLAVGGSVLLGAGHLANATAPPRVRGNTHAPFPPPAD